MSTLASERFNVLGVGVHAIDMDAAIRILDDAIRDNRKGYVCVTGVHGVMEAQHDEVLRGILNRSLLTTPDGMPMVWVGRFLHRRQVSRVYGPDLMRDFCLATRDRCRHFFYGGAPGVAELLACRFRGLVPGINIVGTYTPPFRPLNEGEEAALAAQVAAAKPDIMWVGLSTPKQERFMAQYLERLDVKVMVGVGAAFDIHTGRIKDAPAWVKTSGLQWLHRLHQEPRRLWKRYLVNNPLFVLRLTGQALGLKKYDIDEG
jgi:N-acetylglucosaminyldiphosphoundecaprenol N-acetyl-beta-D-mannosaminyltransferase